MLLKELSVERFAFDCPGCKHEWAVDYDVQHVEDGHGHQLDYYYRNGLASLSPLGPGAVNCPACGRHQTRAKLTSRRVTPVVTADTATHPGHRADESHWHARANAPLLTGEQEAR